jgi:hypothetical protein
MRRTPDPIDDGRALATGGRVGVNVLKDDTRAADRELAGLHDLVHE